MKENVTPDAIVEWNRWFAIECNNAAWDFAAKPDRTEDENQEMLYAAYAAAYHWHKVGNPVNNARADIALAHVFSLLGQGSQALQYAQRSLAYFQTNSGQDWDVAFSHAEVAFAAKVAGDAELHQDHYVKAKFFGNEIQDEEDRKVFFEEFAKIPAP